MFEYIYSKFFLKLIASYLLSFLFIPLIVFFLSILVPSFGISIVFFVGGIAIYGIENYSLIFQAIVFIMIFYYFIFFPILLNRSHQKEKNKSRKYLSYFIILNLILSLCPFIFISSVFVEVARYA